VLVIGGGNVAMDVRAQRREKYSANTLAAWRISSRRRKAWMQWRRAK